MIRKAIGILLLYLFLVITAMGATLIDHPELMSELCKLFLFSCLFTLKICAFASIAVGITLIICEVFLFHE